jgi:CheY-like chemotaxis protein
MKILVLEDDADHILAFQEAARSLSADVIVWRNGHKMANEVAQHLADAALISLDHDLRDNDGEDVGSGMDVVRRLLKHKPTCPVVLHTANISARSLMMNTLLLAGWEVHRVSRDSMGFNWVYYDWLPKVSKLIGDKSANPPRR